MKRATTSYGDLLKVVAAVQHPELTQADRHFLLALALSASSDGHNARPGHKCLAERAAIANNTIRRRIAKLIRLGLISYQSKSRGIHYANVFQFELTNDAYPDDYVGLKGASLPLMGDAGMNIAHEVAEKRCSIDHETPSIASSNGRLSNLLLSTNKPTNPADKVKNVGEFVDTENRSDVADILKSEFAVQEKELPKMVTKQQVSEMISLAKKHGRENFLRVGRIWLKQAPWNDETKSPFAFFIKNFASYMKLAELEKQKEAQRMTPEQEALMIEQARAHHIKVWAIPEPEESEGDGSELFETDVTSDCSNEVQK